MGKKKNDKNLLGSTVSAGAKQDKASEPGNAKRELFAPDKEELIAEDRELCKVKEDDPETGEFFEKCVRHIWQAVEDNRVKLGFAVIGYDFSTGYPVYDYDLIVDLLINYGYISDVAVMFAEELSESKWSDGTKRIVSSSSHRFGIYNEVNPLPDNPCS